MGREVGDGFPNSMSIFMVMATVITTCSEQMLPSLIRHHLPIYSPARSMPSRKTIWFLLWRLFLHQFLMQLHSEFFLQIPFCLLPHWLSSYLYLSSEQGEQCGLGSCGYWCEGPDCFLRPSIIKFICRDKYGTVCVSMACVCMRTCICGIVRRMTQKWRMVSVPLEVHNVQKEFEGAI